MTRFILPYDPAWQRAFMQEALAIAPVFGAGMIALHHIGSTAIPGILAKPIIDMMGVVGDLNMVDRRSDEMAHLGYEVMGEFGIAGRRYFRKSDSSGQRTHHLHVFVTGSADIERHLAFREYLRAHGGKAAQYSDLKARLVSGNQISGTEYADAKAPFVAEVAQLAFDWYRRADRADTG